MFKFIPIGLALVALFGCASDAQRADEAFDIYKQTLPEKNAEYGLPPKNYEKTIKDYLAKSLKDPYSAHYSEFSTPRQEHVIYNKKPVYGYSVCVKVNAKNSYGAYIGNQVHWFFFKDGQITRSNNVTAGATMIYRGRTVNCANGS